MNIKIIILLIILLILGFITRNGHCSDYPQACEGYTPFQGENIN